MDTVSKNQRSKNMASIKSKDTKPEVYLRKLLHNRGYRYRLYKKGLPGKPDLWLAKYNTAIFINGCFWHHHQNCKRATIPKSNKDYWQAKLSRNVARDRDNSLALQKMGIKVLTIWECTTTQMQKDLNFREETLRQIESFLKREISELEL